MEWVEGSKQDGTEIAPRIVYMVEVINRSGIVY